MPYMYVGNATKQVHNFMYNRSGAAGSITQLIPIGAQIQLSGELSTDDMDGIILQHEIYGFPSVDEVFSRKVRFGGIFYSIGKPITQDQLRRAMEVQKNFLIEFGKILRKESAVAISNIIEDQVIGEMNADAMQLNNLEVSVEEQAPVGGATDGQSLLAEGIRVTKTEGPPITPKRSKR